VYAATTTASGDDDAAFSFALAAQFSGVAALWVTVKFWDLLKQGLTLAGYHL